MVSGSLWVRGGSELAHLHGETDIRGFEYSTYLILSFKYQVCEIKHGKSFRSFGCENRCM